MAPEFGGTCGFFAVDNNSIDYLRQTSEFLRFKERNNSFFGDILITNLQKCLEKFFDTSKAQKAALSFL